MTDESAALLREMRRILEAPATDVDAGLRQLGLLYAGTPPPYGAGGEPTLPLRVVEETARDLRSPLWTLTGVLAAQVLLTCPGRWLEDVLATELRVAVSWPGVLGTSRVALGAADSELLIEVSGRDDDSAGVSVFDTAGLEPRPLAALDPTRPLTRPRRDRPLAAYRLDPAASRRLHAFWLLALACDALGSMRACFELGLDHVRGRKAFGRPIGAFQALRHRCADLYVDVETTRATVLEGGRAWAADDPGAGLLALVAASHAVEAGIRVAEAVVLLHGAMGFTREAAPQAHLRRAYAMQALAPDAGAMRRELASA